MNCESLITRRYLRESTEMGTSHTVSKNCEQLPQQAEVAEVPEVFMKDIWLNDFDKTSFTLSIM